MGHNDIARKLTKEELMQLENYDPEYKADLSTSPCKDCPARYVGCHINCYKYQLFRQVRDSYNAAMHKEHESYLNSYKYSFRSKRRK